MGTAWLHRRITIWDLAKNWFVSYFGNLAGMLFFMAIITGCTYILTLLISSPLHVTNALRTDGGVFSDSSEPAYKQELYKFAKQKMIDPGWHQIFLRGIGANWLVCMAVWLSISAREHVSKVVAIWWPTATFVALALDHVIANMYFIPIAIFNGDPMISVSYYIWKSMIPTALGNIVGGTVFMALPYWYLFLTGPGSDNIGFDLGGEETAVNEQSGPDRNKLMRDGNIGNNVIHGREMDETHPASKLPSGNGGLQSAMSKELDPEVYAKTYAEREKATSSSDETV